MKDQRVARPLNQSAILKAYDKVWQENPELEGRRLTLAPEDFRYRVAWLRAYIEAGGSVIVNGTSDSVDHPIQACPLAKASETLSPLPLTDIIPDRPNADSEGYIGHGLDPAQHKRVCRLQSINVMDSEGRMACQVDGVLEVVPHEIGEEISLSAAVFEGGCGSHPTWSISGYFRTKHVGPSHSFRAVHWRVYRASWLANILPRQYHIDASACESTANKVTIRVYPSDKFQFTTNGKWKAAVDSINKAIDVIIACAQPPSDIEDPFKLLEGSCSVSAGWAEHPGDHRAFYKYEASIGYNPLFGAEVTIPFGPTAVVPATVKRFGDAYLFISLSGGISTNGKWARMSPDRHDAWVDVTGYIHVKLGASVFLMNKNVLYAEVAGTSGIDFTGRPSGSDRPSLEWELTWLGIRGEFTIKAIGGFIEFKHEKTIVRGGMLNRGIWYLDDAY